MRRGPATPVPVEQLLAAEQALEQLVVMEPAQADSYDRTFFGNGWLDLDGTGCDTRMEVLVAWMGDEDAKVSGECGITEGEFIDPYSGFLQRYRAGPETGGEVHIDHVVALKDAWIKGAWQWDMAKAWQFANDPANLLPTNAALNMDKSDLDAGSWLPPHDGFHCAFVVTQIQVKAAYELGVSATEKQAMQEVLEDC